MVCVLCLLVWVWCGLDWFAVVWMWLGWVGLGWACAVVFVWLFVQCCCVVLCRVLAWIGLVGFERVSVLVDRLLFLFDCLFICLVGCVGLVWLGWV